MPEVLSTHRYTVLLLAVLLAAASITFDVRSAASQELPDHPHMLVLGFETDDNGVPTGYRRCVDLAGNGSVPLHAHHTHLHIPSGKASQAQRRAGNIVVPGAPLTEWADCEELIDAFFGD